MQISFDLGTMSFSDVKTNEKSISKNLTDVVRKLQEESSPSEKQNDSKMMEKIQAKIKRGKKLTSKEETYLKEHNPELYQQYLRIRRMAEALEHRLENAQSKEEVNDIIFQSINSVSDKDPYKAAIVAAMDEVIKEFKKSDGYKNLPATNEEIEEGRRARAKKAKEKSEDEDEVFSLEEEKEEFDAMSWTPLQEVIDALPTFNMQS